MKTFGQIVCLVLIGATTFAGSATAGEETKTAGCCGHDHASPAAGASQQLEAGTASEIDAQKSPTVGYWAWRTVTHYWGNHAWTQVSYVQLGSWNRVRCNGCGYFFDVFIPF